MRKLNCWEFMNCGREKGGLLVQSMGECPVAISMRYDGENEGVGAGRACWMVHDTLCHKSHQKIGQPLPCLKCEFYQRVQYEEAEVARFRFATEIA